MKQVIESLRKRFREIPGIAVYMQPLQNLRLGGRPSKARYQYTLQSVNAGTMGEWAERLMERMRADPAFRDVTSDSQNRGLQATLDIDRVKAGRARRLGRRLAHRAVQTPTATGRLAASTVPATPTRSSCRPPTATDSSRKTWRVSRCATRPVSWCRCRPSRPSSAPSADLGQSPRPAAGRHRFIQPRTRRAAGRRYLEDRPLQERAEDPSVHHHQLRRRRGGVPELAIEPVRAAGAGGAGDLRAVGRCCTKATSTR